MRRAAVEGILNQLADDFRTRRKIPQVGRWSRHRLATARHFEILEHRNLSDNCSRSGCNDQIVRHSLIIHTRTAQLERQDTSQSSSIATFGQLLSERRQRPDCQKLSHHSYTHKNLQVRRSSLRFTSGLHLLILRAISIDQLLSPELQLTDH